MRIKKLSDVKNLSGQRVLVRADFNVPVEKGKVKENFRIKKVLPTINYLLEHKAKVILVSHLGRPEEGKFEKKFSLAPVAKELGKLLKKKVGFYQLDKFVKLKNPETVTILENIRFIKGEAKNDPKFAKSLSDLADIFVMDGFAVAHRDSASVSGVAKFLPSYAGLLVEEEINGLLKVIEKPKKPMVAVLGGIKCETKIPVLKNLLPKANNILVGGGIANTYLWAQGHQLGKTLIDKDFKKEIITICKNKKIILPIDAVVGDENGKNARVENIDAKKPMKLKANEAIFDIGPKTIQLYSKYIKKASTLVLNGALGYFEQSPYQHGTYTISRLVASRSKGKAFGVAGGGETVEVLEYLGVGNEIDLVSTGGGAMLEFLAGKKLPGIEVLRA